MPGGPEEAAQRARCVPACGCGAWLDSFGITRKVLLTATATLALTLAAVGCGGEDSKDKSGGDSAFATSVREITGEATQAGADGVDLLSQVSEASVEPAAAATRLDALSMRVDASAKKLDALTPPQPVEETASDLLAEVNQLSRELKLSGENLRAAGTKGTDAEQRKALASANERVVAAVNRAVRELSDAVQSHATG
jgi:hypothetical protein